MPKDFLFPSIPGVSRVITLTANRAYGPDLLGTMVNLAGYTLNLVSPSGSGSFMVCGAGNLTGALVAALTADQAVSVAVSGVFKFVDGGASVVAGLAAHTSRTDNPHNVTKAQVGLGSVDNTPDSAKPISTAQAAALAGKAPLNHTHPALTRTEIQGHPSNSVLGSIASGQISFDDDYIVDGDTLTVAGVVFTYRDVPVASRDIAIGDAAGSTIAANTADVLENHLDTILHASTGSGTPWIVDLHAVLEGASGNSIGMSGVFSNPAAAVFSGSTLAGGVDGVVPSSASYLGQKCRVGDAPGPFVWYEWDGVDWVLLPSMASLPTEAQDVGAVPAPIIRSAADGAPPAPVTIMRVSGAGYSAANGDYVASGEILGVTSWVSPSGAEIKRQWELGGAGQRWVIEHAGSYRYQSSEDPITPDMVENWAVASGSLPLPSVEQLVLNPAVIGQLCRVGDGSGPFTWYRFDGVAWVNITVTLASVLSLLGITIYPNHANALADLPEGSVYFDSGLARLHSVSLDTYYSS